MKNIFFLILFFISINSVFANNDNVLNISAVGDVMHSYFTAHTAKFDALKGNKYKLTRHLIENADLSFVNLETPYTNNSPVIKKVFSYATKPIELRYIFECGFNLFSLSNNHSADAGFTGLNDTLNLIETYNKEFSQKENSKKYIWAGTGRTTTKAREYRIFTIKNFKIAFLAYGINRSPFVNQYKLKNILDDIRKVKKEKVDLIIVSAHTGNEYVHIPNPSKISDFRKIIDSGAHIILGHHPHVVQGIENYKNGIIFYSLGNYSFGSMTIRHLKKNAKLYGMIAQLEVVKSENSLNISTKVTPLYVDNQYPMKKGNKILKIKSFQPAIPDEPFASEILKSIKNWSLKIPGNNSNLAITNKNLVTNIVIKKKVNQVASLNKDKN